VRKNRILPLLLTWGSALVVTFVMESFGFNFHDAYVLLLCFWMFPGGLITELFGLERGDSWFGLAFGWLAYLIVMLAALFANKRLLYYMLYGILCLMLILNIAGCHEDIADCKKS
jgi:hypothetical protein